jgi:hypothetical protein
LQWGLHSLRIDRQGIEGSQGWYVRSDKILLGIHAMDCENTLKGTVREMAIAGMGYRIQAQVEGAQALEMFASSAIVEGLNLKPGSSLFLGIPAQAITFLPSPSEALKGHPVLS